MIETVDLQKKRLHATSGESFEFETLLIATGARARKLECPGNDLPNVFYLRSLNDSRTIRASTESCKQAVVLGGGFIGMEVSAVLAQKNIETTLILREDRVWSRVFTAPMSEFFERYYTSRVLKRESVVRLEGKDRVRAAVLFEWAHNFVRLGRRRNRRDSGVRAVYEQWPRCGKWSRSE